MLEILRNKKALFTLLIALFLSIGTPVHTARAARESRDARRQNEIFNYTHMLQSPYTLPAGTLIFGTTVALGIADIVDVSTNLLLDFYQIYNANLKAGVLDMEDFAFALTFGWQRFNYRDISAANPDLLVNSYRPGVVVAIKIDPSLAVFFGGDYNISSSTLITNGITTSGWVHGTTTEADFSWAYGQIKKNGIQNVISAGATYDVDYRLWGFGMSHHWPGFQLGFHYYPDAGTRTLQPIISGGGVIQL